MITRSQVRNAPAFGAIVAVALLLNAFVLAPAFHHHGPMHDASTCAICTTHATGSIAPPADAELPRPALTALDTSGPRIARPNRPTIPTVLVRGPPLAMANLI